MTTKRLPTILLLALAASSALYAQNAGNTGENWSKGPLVGRNWYLPFSIYYQYPGYSARSGEQFEFQYHVSSYYTNDFSGSFATDYQNTDIDNPPPEYPSAMYVSRDFESYNAGIGVSFRPLRRLALGMDLHLVSYFGGFLDPLINSFHDLFGFPNGGREFVPYNQVSVDIQNASGVQLFLDRGAISLGDIDLHARYTFLEDEKVALAAYGAFKLPTGRLETLSGSGYPDMGMGIIADYMPSHLISIFGQAGMTIPLDSFLPGTISTPKPFFVGMTGIELTPVRRFSMNVQLNFKSPSLEPSLADDTHWIFQNHNRLLLPQICLLVGCIWEWRGLLWQFYVEEDPLTNVGTDFTCNLTLTHTLE